MKRLTVMVALCVALAADAKTKVMLFFDTEDYTCDRSNDAIRDIANLLTSEGVRGNFNIADFLFAALEVLETGTASVTVVPREQLGSFKLVPGLENMKISGKWIHPDSFKDEYLSERMRLQHWTLRIE